MIRKFRLASFAALALAASVAATQFSRADDQTLATGTSAPAFTLQDQNGKSVSLTDYPGKIVVLEWTNPDCPFVKAAYQKHEMTKLAEEYKDKDVVWLAIDSTAANNPAKDLAWATRQHISYPILSDASGKVGHAYAAKTTPDMFVIDKTGKIVYSGAIDNAEEGKKDSGAEVNYVKDALDAVIAGKPVAVPHTESYGCAVHYAK
jgi:peroxiredoxin